MSDSDSSSQMQLAGNDVMMGNSLASTIPLKRPSAAPETFFRFAESTEKEEKQLKSDTEDAKDSSLSALPNEKAINSKKKKTMLYVLLAIVALILLIVVAYFATKRFAKSEKESTSLEVEPAAKSAALYSPLPPNSKSNAFSAPRHVADRCEEESTGASSAQDEEDTESSFYYPTPLQGTPVRELFDSVENSIDEENLQTSPTTPYMTPPTTASAASVNFSVANDEKKYQPPPSSFFGATFKTRGEAAEDVSDSVLQNAEAMASIYNKKANAVLAVNGIKVHDTVARDMGWAEIGDPGAPEISNVNEAAHFAPETTTSSSIFDTIKQQIPLHQVRSGSSASTVVTAQMAAADAAAVVAPDERGSQFAAGRAKAQEITAQTQAAVGNIYQRKRQASAGLTAASAARSSNQNDPTFEYINSFTNATM